MNFSHSQLVFGTGGRFGRLSQTLADQLVSHSLANNINIFDTGMEYSNGKSQQKLVNSLRSVSIADRSSFKFSTKVKPTSLRGVVANSVARLTSSFLHYIDYLFLWGPVISDLSSPYLFDELLYLKEQKLINSIGINTHDLSCLQYLADNISDFPIDHIMLDFNLLRQDRLPVMNRFAAHGVKIWAGTVLCQGFLIQSLLELILRTRSLSYLARATLQPETKILLSKSKKLRTFLRLNYPYLCRTIPLQYALQCELVDFVPLGMLSSSSITRNVKALFDLIPRSVIQEVEDWALLHAQLD